ncbi:hypothetical protein HPB50_016990 [Hyalomma asiaticum]|uniref:Uncharacterized protein n=1 Tax=Hyalomma asiaticum TaxID=266040 RepID=A0ACB7T8K5_HYAAI|nr:hypothetical protein HPB50_016990 [Hyalomma asiaticum]
MDTGEGLTGTELPNAGHGGSTTAGSPEAHTELDQASELQGLGVSVYSGADLEQGVLEEMDRIVQQKEAEERQKATEKRLLALRKDITAVKKRIDRLERSMSTDELASSHHISPVVFTMRRDRDNKVWKKKGTTLGISVPLGEVPPVTAARPCLRRVSRTNSEQNKGTPNMATPPMPYIQ